MGPVMAVTITKTVDMMVKHYKQMQRFGDITMITQARREFVDMARGGDGGESGSLNSTTGETKVRDIHYPGLDNGFFQRVCDRMGWDEWMNEDK
tara:strand:+ start:785 stop:1066 length:282 start_codon:yes stop_codon:yes gene_type:complete